MLTYSKFIMSAVGNIIHTSLHLLRFYNNQIKF